MIAYIIKHHVPGQISLDVPALRKIAEYRLKKISEAVRRLPVFMGIRDLTVNPGNGSVAIEYDAEVVDIIDYLEDMSVIVETLDCLERQTLDCLERQTLDCLERQTLDCLERQTLDCLERQTLDCLERHR